MNWMTILKHFRHRLACRSIDFILLAAMGNYRKQSRVDENNFFCLPLIEFPASWHRLLLNATLKMTSESHGACGDLEKIP